MFASPLASWHFLWGGTHPPFPSANTFTCLILIWAPFCCHRPPDPEICIISKTLNLLCSSNPSWTFLSSCQEEWAWWERPQPSGDPLVPAGDPHLHLNWSVMHCVFWRLSIRTCINFIVSVSCSSWPMGQNTQASHLSPCASLGRRWPCYWFITGPSSGRFWLILILSHQTHFSKMP